MGAESGKLAEENALKNLNKLRLNGKMAEWLKAADCKSVEFSHRRFESYSLLTEI